MAEKAAKKPAASRKKTSTKPNAQTIRAAEKRIGEVLSAKGREQEAMELLTQLGETFQISQDADFCEAARSFAEEAALIARMRERLDKDGLTIVRETKGGDYLCAHPLLTELPRHVTCANNTLSAIGEIILRRGARKEQKTKLSEFRIG